MNGTETSAWAEELLRRRDLLCARAAFDEAEARGADPDRCSGGRWITSMLLGDFEQAWRESDAIRTRGRDDPYRFWRGEDISESRIIVRSLHGFGDAVQMLRYAPALKAVAKSVTLEVAPRLVELAGCIESVDQVVTWGNDAPQQLSVWEVQLEVMELPYFFRTTLKDLPLAKNYLKIPRHEIKRSAMTMGLPNRLRVGLAWSAGDWNKSREILPELLQPLLPTMGVEFWSLHPLGRTEALGEEVRDTTAECGSGLMNLAAAIANLDLVITVDTLAAHLGGALGRPTWVMLQHEADWRWMVGRSDSPWYPQMRLFRQAQQGDWRGVIRDVKFALKEWAQLRGEG